MKSLKKIKNSKKFKLHSKKTKKVNKIKKVNKGKQTMRGGGPVRLDGLGILTVLAKRDRQRRSPRALKKVRRDFKGRVSQ